MERMVIEVFGIPDIGPADRMVDHLKIHFLSRSNSGADVLAVLYPTSDPGKAHVIFESDEVPGVLQCTHVLEVGSTFYPIRVKRAHQSEVDMPVETKLDISLFSKRSEVRQLLKSHGFEVTPLSTDLLHLKGSFLSLKLLRKRLSQLLAEDKQDQSRSPPDLSNGYASSFASKTEPDTREPRSVQYSPNQAHAISNGVHPPFQRPRVNGVPSSVSPSSLNLQQSTSPVYSDSASGGSPRSLPNSVDDSSFSRPSSSNQRAGMHPRFQRPLGVPSSVSPFSLDLQQSTSPVYADSASGGSPRSLPNSADDSSFSRPSSSNQRAGMHPRFQRPLGVPSSVSPFSLDLQQSTSPVYADSASGGSPRSLPNSADDSSFSRPSSSNQRANMIVEKDVLDYALAYRQDFFRDIETHYRTEMSLINDGEITMVMFSGRDREKAQAKVEALIQDISPGLRTQEIHLNEYSPDQQAKICEGMQLYKARDYHVLIKLDGDVVKLVGSSSRSFQVKQKLLGHNDDLSTSSRRGRELERNSGLRRSSSLPRHYKVSKENTDQRHPAEPQYHASVAKDYSPSHNQEESRSGKASKVAQEHPRTPNEPAARRRSSSEVRNKNRDVRELPRQHDEVTLPSSGGQIQSAKKQFPSLKTHIVQDLHKIGAKFKHKQRKKT